MTESSPFNPAGILLAAGESRRMGSPKALLELGGRTFFRHAEDAMRAHRLRPAAAVLNPVTRQSVKPQWQELEILVNPRPEEGQLSSLQIALGWMLEQEREEDRHGGAFLLLVDNPGRLTERLGLLVEAVQRAPDFPAAPSWKDKRGHPLWLPRRLWEGVIDWTGPEGLRGFLRAENEEIRKIEMPHPSVLWDIDTPEEYREVRGE